MSELDSKQKRQLYGVLSAPIQVDRVLAKEISETGKFGGKRVFSLILIKGNQAAFGNSYDGKMGVSWQPRWKDTDLAKKTPQWEKNGYVEVPAGVGPAAAFIVV